MWAGIGEVHAAQADGSSPTPLAAGSAPGESGVSVLRMRFHGGMHFAATPQRHCVCFQMPQLRIERRMAGRALRREAPAGSLAICPAGFDCAADVEESVDGLVVAIDPGWFSLAAAEDSALGAQLTWTLPFGLLTMFAVINRFDRSYEEAASDLGASAWQRLIHVSLPILLPGILGVGVGAFTLSYDEYARTTLTAGNRNTLPLEIYALISSSSSPMLFAIGTVTTALSFLLIGVTLWIIVRMQRRRGRLVGAV